MKSLYDIVAEHIVILDGAMGTMIQRNNLTESDFRGDIFTSHDRALMGNNDILTITQPDIIAAIHRAYLEAGADIIETCTFNAQRVSQAEYGTAEYVEQINRSAVAIARKEAERMSRLTPDKPRFVAGSIGPTGRSLSISPDVENPALRTIDFDTLSSAYREQISVLVEGGVDMLIIETIFDTLNAKAALMAAHEVFNSVGHSLPIILSITIADSSGRMLSGQTIEAFIASVCHHNLFAVGINCSYGAEQMLPSLRQLAEVSPFRVCAYPNAGLPDQMGNYNQTPKNMAAAISRFAKERLVNIVGGCCGSTPDHIRAIAEAVESYSVVRQPHTGKVAWLAGIDGSVQEGEAMPFVNVGERCNVAGSRKFLRLIKEKSYDEALSIARAQVRAGAMVLDINMDDAMLDTIAQMTTFLNIMSSDPEVARLPWMIDSSQFDVIEAALKCVQGKAIVNSLSLKEGEELFLQRARRVKEFGAALVVMAFDEEGQATTYERRIAICERAYHLLTERVGFDPHDIIFDPNILTIATGIREHDSYALDFIRATRWIRQNLPHAKVSGGVSNLSFAFRGNNYIREAMHAVFLYHAVEAGLSMAIVNPSSAVMYENIDAPLREALEDVILCRKDDASEQLTAMAAALLDNGTQNLTTANVAERANRPIEDRLVTALQCGDEEFLQSDLEEALSLGNSAASIIEGTLMRGMTLVGELFGEGKMFLPQVVKTARTMKRAVEILRPHLESQNFTSQSNNGRYLLATVKGDVHDIGKNIVSVVLGCNNFEVIDLGVMVRAEEIVEAAITNNVQFIGLSGLITPSLEEMCRVAARLCEAGVSVPLFIGGATTSALHTAVKIAPLYDGPVFYVRDAAQNPLLAMQLLGAEHDTVLRTLHYEQEQLRHDYLRQQQCHTDGVATVENRLKVDWANYNFVKPNFQGIQSIENISIEEVLPYINWRHFNNLWGVRSDSHEAEELRRDAELILEELAKHHSMSARVGIFEACGTDSEIVISHSGGCRCCKGGFSKRSVIHTPRQHQTGNGGNALSLCDYVAPEGYGDYVGAFAVTISKSFAKELELRKNGSDRYATLLMQSLADRLTEATSEWLHAKVRREIWGYAADESLTPREMFAAAYRGIRPAVGYPSLPEQSEIFNLAELLNISDIGISLTENGAMYPQASVCGLYIAYEGAKYFVI